MALTLDFADKHVFVFGGTTGMALEWVGDCIRVNLISPGSIAGTEGAKRLSLPGSEEKAIESIP
jgi:NAD(P)-dependent dehydrogenase (short-subunit alcohol dehydrogenase family)